MATFGLVHGAGHGAWCWDRLIPALAAYGHRAATMDLPCADPAAGAQRYAEVVDRALPPADDLILVGHSLGGLTIPLVAGSPGPAGRVPVRVDPRVRAGRGSGRRADPTLYHPVLRLHPGRLTDPDGTVRFRDETAVRDVFCHDCEPADVRWVFSRLRPRRPRPARAVPSLAAWPPGEPEATSSAVRTAPSLRTGRAGLPPVPRRRADRARRESFPVHLPARGAGGGARPSRTLTLGRATLHCRGGLSCAVAASATPHRRRRDAKMLALGSPVGAIRDL